MEVHTNRFDVVVVCVIAMMKNEKMQWGKETVVVE